MVMKMYNRYIKFASATTAQKAARILRDRGITASLGKNPGHEKGEGCSYALFLSADPGRAVRLLNENGVKTNGTGELRTP